jgi:hypothetical protein
MKKADHGLSFPEEEPEHPDVMSHILQGTHEKLRWPLDQRA